MSENRHAETDEILKKTVGIVRSGLSDTEPADIALKAIADATDHHWQQAQTYATAIDRTLHEFTWGVIPMHTLASESDTRNFDGAVASLNALHEPLHAAAHAYRLPHQNSDAH
ncbi:hypothetical protein F1721_32875 [Saccharopolyspora hirsuta]|uniref:Uncharacterized protein n=1 Tax=Saccharopolyspora hirsuta TaxID=1837 RepID=A0A5M7B7A7_SACHI|nr:hypothetical protein [Saccharopolyspora hirsuta]KAA5825433.1 hypothetical protein F1721_32875 [Saccharopolyspora hirsuta]